MNAERSDVFILSSLPPSATQKWLAFCIVFTAAVVIWSTSGGPPKAYQVVPFNAFIPAYTGAMFVCLAVTAILLYAQFYTGRSLATLVIATGYFFLTLVLIIFILVYPGIISPGTGLYGNVNSAPWNGFFWRTGFALFTIGYALLKDNDSDWGQSKWSPGQLIAFAMASTSLLVFAAGIIIIYYAAALPEVNFDYIHNNSNWLPYIGLPTAAANALAAIILLLRQRSVLDLWLLVVVCLEFISVFSGSIRLSPSFYAIRLIGLSANILITTVLLLETARLYSKLHTAVTTLRREREARLMTGDAVAATIAHEVNQPLTAMITQADAGLRFLDRTTPDIDEAKQAFKYISADGHRADAIIGSIRLHFKNEVRQSTLLDVNSLIQESVALVKNDLFANRVSIKAKLQDGLPQIDGNRVQLQQVLVNLFANAVESMSSNSGPRILTVESWISTDGAARISVADTGAGVRSENVEKIFNPLFTTKTNGMGMGLAICRSIVEAHQGRLWVAPDASGGATFHIALKCIA